MLEYLALRILSLLAPVLPPGLGYRFCELAGDWIYRLLPSRRENVFGNLARALGETPSDMGDRVRRVFREGVKYYYDTFRTPALTDTDLDRLITVTGWENLDRGLAMGKGVILFTAHLGSPALVAQILRVRKYNVVTVVEPVKPRRLYDLMVRVRGSRGIRLIRLGPNSTRELTHALKRNEVVGVVVDRDLAGTGAKVEFFGIESSVPTGPVMLALRTGAALVPAFTYREEGGCFLGRIGEPLGLERTGELRKDLRANTQKLARVLEAAIRERPEQWIVFEPVWPKNQSGAGQGVAG